MKYFLVLASLVISLNISAQVASSNPALPVDTDEVTVTFDVSKGSGNLMGYTGDVYVHTGVLTAESSGTSDWKYVQTNWGVNSPETKLSRIGTDLYQITISPNPREYYSVSEETVITSLAFVLRSGVTVGGSYLECKEADGKDIFVEIYEPGLQVSIVSPAKNLLTTKSTDILFEAAASDVANMTLYLNDSEVKTVSGSFLTHTFNFPNSGDYWAKVKADNTTEIVYDSVFIHILADAVTESLPGGSVEGFNQTSATSGILALYAPGKEHVFIIGDFNAWTPSSVYRMKNDNGTFWLELTGLMAGEEYAYQYLVDGELTIADPYSEKVLDPWNDKYISDVTYPDLKEYPAQFTTGITSVLQTNKPEYQWSGDSFTAPGQDNLVIYELLLRDFIAAHDWKTLTDTLNYFSSLGVNAIELMPFNEFEGNESWGYNPSFYFAVDKYYGPANDLKEFIDSCHNRGIAVIMDMVLNHSYGQSPLVQLYWNSATNKPASDNPWYNVSSPNTAYSWGYDFNHESLDTKKFIDRVNAYWMNEFRLDGFRFDFTKGFTNTPGDGSSYDASRIAILKRMSDAIWSVNPDAYVILEHFAPNNEEKVLADYGMMVWGNINYNYNEATMGWHDSGKSDFGWVSYKARGWNDPNLVGYMESHDEERLMVKNILYGNGSGDYNIKETETALGRIELAAAFFISIPGPKMIWQFGEMGYDFSIDFNGRVGNKPIRWDYYNSRKRVRQVYSELNKLKWNEPAFSTDNYTISVSSALKRIELNHTDMDVRIIGNFDVVNGSISPNFSKTGMWYEYFTGTSLDVSDVNAPINLVPGEYRLYTTKQFTKPELATDTRQTFSNSEITLYPNPATDRLFIDSPTTIQSIELFDLAGRLVKSAQPFEKNASINISDIEEGYYALRVKSGGGLSLGKVLKGR
ncbi:MAG: T9SS type A sorting domain-containing protein [Bacteroidales bacterium]|nr:T9SS type A sorting domain-containing protein [Bacteroidales bacterium]MCF8390644.1 T9SS type A sorting domain-containing protein [Bacteroidales bacterium]